MDAVVHFEMPYDDAERVAAFYSSAFGWNTQALGAEMGDYVLAIDHRDRRAPARRLRARSTAASSRGSPTGRRNIPRS